MRSTMKFFAMLILMGIVFCAHTFAETGRLQATIVPIDGKPFVIEDFTINGDYFYDAVWEGKPVKLSFQDIKEIKFLNPGKNYDAEVSFNNGSKGAYLLQPAGDIIVLSQYSFVSLGHSKVARIVFGPAQIEQPQANIPPGGQPLSNPQPGTFDRVILKNGDSLSGQIQTMTFTVRTAYGTFQLETPKIASIEFDAKGPNTALVLLRNGDRISGTVEVDPVLFVTTSGQGISFDGKAIRIINFKR